MGHLGPPVGIFHHPRHVEAGPPNQFPRRTTGSRKVPHNSAPPPPSRWAPSTGAVDRRATAGFFPNHWSVLNRPAAKIAPFICTYGGAECRAAVLATRFPPGSACPPSKSRTRVGDHRAVLLIVAAWHERQRTFERHRIGCPDKAGPSPRPAADRPAGMSWATDRAQSSSAPAPCVKTVCKCRPRPWSPAPIVPPQSCLAAARPGGLWGDAPRSPALSGSDYKVIMPRQGTSSTNELPRNL